LEIRVTARPAPPSRIVELDADLREASYRSHGEWVNLRATFEHVDFSRSVFDPFNATGATFIDCTFTGARFKSGSLGITKGCRQSIYRRCRFERADLRGVSPDTARFEACQFVDARIDGWWADAAEFVDCRFVGRLRKVRFTGRPVLYSIDVGRAQNEFRGNDFRDADLDWVEFIWGIDLSAQLLPPSSHYVRLDRPRERVARARADVARWARESDRDYAFFWLRELSEGGNAEQAEVFIRRDNITGRNRLVGERLLALLETPL
jgi:uncharacterized protein YjbI with pentapeptide repeats